jgi:hypothetical protein
MATGKRSMRLVRLSDVPRRPPPDLKGKTPVEQVLLLLPYLTAEEQCRVYDDLAQRVGGHHRS